MTMHLNKKVDIYNNNDALEIPTKTAQQLFATSLVFAINNRNIVSYFGNFKYFVKFRVKKGLFMTVYIPH